MKIYFERLTTHRFMESEKRKRKNMWKWENLKIETYLFFFHAQNARDIVQIT